MIFDENIKCQIKANPTLFWINNMKYIYKYAFSYYKKIMQLIIRYLLQMFDTLLHEMHFCLNKLILHLCVCININ